MNYIVQAKHIQVTITESQHQLEIRFENGYQYSLMNDYRWSENQIDNVDVEIQNTLKQKGFDVEVYWEDRELFVIEKQDILKGLNGEIVAASIQSFMPNSILKAEPYRNKRISKKEFSMEREDLILQIRWLLNEMGAALDAIEEGELEEAKKILKDEVEKNIWMRLSTKKKG